MHASEIVLVSLAWTLGSPWRPATEYKIYLSDHHKAYYTYIGMYIHKYMHYYIVSYVQWGEFWIGDKTHLFVIRRIISRRGVIHLYWNAHIKVHMEDNT